MKRTITPMHIMLTILSLMAIIKNVSAQNRPFPQQMNWSGCIKPNHVSQAQLDADVISFYESWKTNYLKPTNMPNGYYVEGGCTGCVVPSKGTSEGHGYGMLVTVLMAGYDPNAKTYYDGLYNFFDQHRSTINNELMGWNVAVDERQNAFSSATDGDMDIAYSLLLAHYQWGSDGTIDYLQEAVDMINNGLKGGDFGLSNHRVLLGDWANNSSYDTRSSDWMTAQIRAYYEHTGDNFWTNVNDECYYIIDEITSNYAPSTGLMPDFVINATPQPAPPNFLEADTDDDYSWNACRYPWRVAMDYGHYGTIEAKTAMDNVSSWLISATANNPSNIKAVYTLAGTAMNTWSSLAFTAPFVTSCVTNPSNQSYLNAGWDVIKNPDNSYFGDCISLLCMLYISGNWWIPEDNGVSCSVPDLGSDVSLCGAGSATLDGGISSDGTKTFTWEKDGSTVAGPSTSLDTYVASSAGTYTLTIDSAGACSSSDEIVVTATLQSPNLGPDVDLCDPATVTLDANVSGGGISYSWEKDGSAIAGETSSTLSNVNSAGIYTVIISASGCGTDSDDITVTSSVPAGVNDTICSAGTADLSVTGGVAPFDWYTASSGGTSLNTGNTYSPSVASTTTYYVGSGGGSSSATGGRSGNSGSGWYESPGNFDYQLQFDAYQDFTLDYVTVYAQGAQTITLSIYESDNSTLVGTVSVAVNAGQSQIPVGIFVPAGTDYRMSAVGTNGLIWLDDNASLPYETPGVLSIHTFITPWGSESWYWAFYDWQVTVGAECERIPVVAVIDPVHPSCSGGCDDPGSATLSPSNPAAQCGGSITLTASESGSGAFEYEFFRDGVSIQGPGSSNTYDAAQSGSYTVEITDPNDPGACVSVSSAVNVTIDDAPSISVAGSNQTVCEGATINLSANNPTIGTGIWSKVAGTGSVDNTSSNTTTVSGITAGTSSTFRWTIGNGSCPDETDEVIVTVDAAPSTAMAGSDQSVCSATAVLSANTPAIGTGVWTTVSGSGSADSPSSNTSAVSGLTSGSSTTLRWTISNGVCTPTFDEVVITRSTSLAVSVVVSLDQTTVCEGDNVTATATGTNGGSAPQYEWFVNSSSVQGPGTSDVYTFSPADGDQVHVVMTSDLTCTSNNPATSNSISINVDQQPDEANAGNDISVCTSSANLNAGAITIGSGQWSLVSGCGTLSNNQDPNTAVTGLCNGDNVFSWTTSNGVCPDDVDQIIVTRTTMAPVSVSVTASSSSICEGASVTFSGTGNNGGSNPQYEWFVNSLSTQGPGSSNTFTYTPTDGDVVHAVYTSDLGCASNNPATSNSENISVISNANVEVTILLDESTICEGEQVTATATETNGGSIPQYEWFVNSVSTQGPSTQSSYTFTPANNDQVYVIMTSDLSCTTGNPATSASESIAVDNEPDVASAGDDQIICSTSANLSANTPVVGVGAWSVITGSVTIDNSSSPTAIISGISDDVLLSWTISNGVCASSSDEILITHDCPTSAADEIINSFRVYPNPFSSGLIVEGEGIDTIEVLDISGKGLLSQETTDFLTRLDLESYPSGVYILKVHQGTSVVAKRIMKQD